MNCDRCPRSGRPCNGSEIPRLCELVDPFSAEHRPEYVDALDPDRYGLTADNGGEPETPPPLLTLSVTLEANRLGLLNCPESESPSCSCEGSAWCRRNARLVVLRDCAACLGLA